MDDVSDFEPNVVDEPMVNALVVVVTVKIVVKNLVDHNINEIQTANHVTEDEILLATVEIVHPMGKTENVDNLVKVDEHLFITRETTIDNKMDSETMDAAVT